MRKDFDDLYGYTKQNIAPKIAEIPKESKFATQEYYSILDDEIKKVPKAPKEKKKKRSSKVLLTVLIVILLVIAAGTLGSYAYTKIYLTAERFLDTSLDKMYNQTLLSLKSMPEDSLLIDYSKPYHVASNFNFTSNIAEYYDFTNFKFSLDEYLDINKNTLYYSLDIDNATSDFFAGEMYFKDNIVYYNSENIYNNSIYAKNDKSISEMLEDTTIVNSIFPSGIYGLINNFGEVIVDCLKESDIKTINKGLTVVYKYNINASNKKNIAQVINDFTSSDTFLNIFNTISKNDTPTVTPEDIPDINLTIEMNIITQKIVAINVDFDDDYIHGIRINDNKFRFTDSNNDYIDIEIYENEFTITTTIDEYTDSQFKIEKSDNTINCSLIIEGYTLKLNVEQIEENAQTIDLRLETADYILNVDYQTTIDDNSYSYTGNIGLDIAGSTLGIDFTSNITFGEEVPIKLYEDTISLEDLTEEDYNLIANNINTIINSLPDNPIIDFIALFMVESEKSNGTDITESNYV